MVRSFILFTALTLAAGCASSTGSPETGSESTAAAGTSRVPAETGSDAAAPTETNPVLFPDVVEVELNPGADGTYTVAVTLSSPYDSPERYADAWRLLSPDGDVLAVRELTHDHDGEQPFTRSVSDVAIAADIAEVTAEGRDQQSGWGGATITVAVPR